VTKSIERAGERAIWIGTELRKRKDVVPLEIRKEAKRIMRSLEAETIPNRDKYRDEMIELLDSDELSDDVRRGIRRRSRAAELRSKGKVSKQIAVSVEVHGRLTRIGNKHGESMNSVILRLLKDRKSYRELKRRLRG